MKERLELIVRFTGSRQAAAALLGMSRKSIKNILCGDRQPGAILGASIGIVSELIESRASEQLIRSILHGATKINQHGRRHEP